MFQTVVAGNARGATIACNGGLGKTGGDAAYHVGSLLSCTRKWSNWRTAGYSWRNAGGGFPNEVNGSRVGAAFLWQAVAKISLDAAYSAPRAKIAACKSHNRGPGLRQIRFAA